MWNSIVSVPVRCLFVYFSRWNWQVMKMEVGSNDGSGEL